MWYSHPACVTELRFHGAWCPRSVIHVWCVYRLPVHGDVMAQWSLNAPHVDDQNNKMNETMLKALVSCFKKLYYFKYPEWHFCNFASETQIYWTKLFRKWVLINMKVGQFMSQQSVYIWLHLYLSHLAHPIVEWYPSCIRTMEKLYYFHWNDSYFLMAHVPIFLNDLSYFFPNMH